MDHLINKRNIIIALSIVVLIIVALVFWFFLKKRSSPPNTSLLETTTANIIKSGDASKCASVNQVADGVNYETVCKNNIAQNKAVANLDISACNNLDDKLMSIAGCQSEIIAMLAAKATSVSFCDQWSGVQGNGCRINFWTDAAMKSDNASPCANVSVSSSQVAACETDFLMFTMAAAPTSIPDCTTFTTPAAKQQCQDITKTAAHPTLPDSKSALPNQPTP
jgi:hypothetical protein